MNTRSIHTGPECDIIDLQSTNLQIRYSTTLSGVNYVVLDYGIINLTFHFTVFPSNLLLLSTLY